MGVILTSIGQLVSWWELFVYEEGPHLLLSFLSRTRFSLLLSPPHRMCLPPHHHLLPPATTSERATSSSSSCECNRLQLCACRQAPCSSLRALTAASPLPHWAPGYHAPRLWAPATPRTPMRPCLRVACAPEPLYGSLYRILCFILVMDDI